MFYYPQFVSPPITDRTQEDIEEVKAYLNGTAVYEDLYGQTDDLQDANGLDLYAKRSPYRFKGALNYTDLNRIEYNFMECAKALIDWGYPMRTIESVNDESMCSEGYLWEMASIPYLSMIDTIRDNASIIKKNFLTGYPKTIDYTQNPDYEDINILEDIAQTVYDTLHRIEESSIYCGQSDFVCGG